MSDDGTVHGSGHLKAGSAGIAEPTIAGGYLWAAEDFMRGFQRLVKSSDSVEAACCLLAAQSLECALKAYLAHAARGGARVEGHNIQGLWSEASLCGLGISTQLPHWAERLGELHDRPYHLRYREGVHGILMPELAAIASELPQVVRAAYQAINATTSGADG